jgi:uncharacterized heparinase superfamily protein
LLWRTSELLKLIILYFHTLRYLKAKQIYFRLWFLLVKRRVDKRNAAPLRTLPGVFQKPACRRASLLSADTFFFLNQVGCLDDLGWSGSSTTKLWCYNQHYFDDLTALNAAERKDWHQALLSRWIAENPVAHGVGWESYPTSLRIVNWVKWQYAGNKLPDPCLLSLSVQARWLCHRMEWHILGNHLFANAKALVFAGLFFSGEEAHGWLTKGLEIVNKELTEQILSDGGNFERSPMYHSIFLEDLLDLINLATAFKTEIPEVHLLSWRDAAARMLCWLQNLLHPDGEISFFNDAAIGIAPQPAELKAYARRLGVSNLSPPIRRLVHLSDSGYIRLASKEVVALIDVGPIGPDYIPGHAHADTLSFELSLFGQRILVNGGTSEYGMGDVRIHERSTASHNTLEINGENSSEVWGGFRVARRAYPYDLVIQETAASVSVSCAHNGYCRLPGRPVHRRSWNLSGCSLVVEDRVEGYFETAYAYFHAYPDVELRPIMDNSWVLTCTSGKQVVLNIEQGESSLIESYHAPEFGRRLSTMCLKVAMDLGGSRVRISWGDRSG